MNEEREDREKGEEKSGALVASSPRPELGLWDEAAVIINHNARKASRKVKRAIEDVGPYIHVYYTKTLDEARHYARKVIESGFLNIFSAGGDGSLTQLINLLKEAIDEYEKGREDGASRPSLPRIGVLKYGTGNGVASMLGIKRGYKNIKRIVEEGYDKVREINLIESSGKLFPFAGIGLDARVLNDFKYVTSKFNGAAWWRRISGGFVGYIATTFGYSAPKYLFSRPARLEIVNTGDEVYSVSYGVEPSRRKVKYGETLYSGKAVLVGVGTVPNYGYGLKAFPFAFDKPGFMNLRIINMSIPRIVWNAPRIWRGAIRDKGFIDFLAQSVRINLDKPMPYQISGDAAGMVSSAQYSVSELTVKLFDFHEPKELTLGLI
ncbi:MAG: hypothetical protein Kow0090_03960 [Myxococcota bacterium]